MQKCVCATSPEHTGFLACEHARRAMLFMHTRFKELFTSVSHLLPVQGSVPLQEFSPVKLRTDHGQPNPNNKEISALFQESELVGLPFGC